MNSGTTDITVPSQYASSGSGATLPRANAAAGQSSRSARGAGHLGYEWDTDADNGFRPPGEFDLSSTTVSGVQAFTDYGSTTRPRHRDPPPVAVPGAEWSAGVRRGHGAVGLGPGQHQRWAPPALIPTDPNMQQATVNLFADMGVQPTTLMAGARRSDSLDRHTPPTSTITSPAPNATCQDGNGSRSRAARPTAVAGSSPASRSRRTAAPHGTPRITGADAQRHLDLQLGGDRYPSTTIETRAVDDSGNLETPSDATRSTSAAMLDLGHVRHPADPDSGDTGVDRGRRQVPVLDRMARSPESASTRPQPTPGRTSATSGTRAGSCSHRRRSRTRPASGWQPVPFAAARHGPAEHHVRRVATSRHTDTNPAQ